MNKLLLLVSAATLIGSAAVPAVAQDSSASTQATGAQRGADEITCQEISTMDTATVPGVLYYISGYNVGREEGMAGATGGTASNTTGTTTGGSDAGSGTTAQSGSTTSGSATTDSTASADSGTAADTTASTTNAPAADASGSGTTADTSGSTTTADSSAAGSSSGTSATANPQVAMIRGYFQIPVENIVVACRNAPDSRASDVIKQQSGSGTNGTSAN
jgi:hypothetical protein